MTEVIPRLWIGDIHDAENRLWLKENSIFAVVNCLDGSVMQFPEITYHPVLCMGDAVVTGVEMEEVCRSTGEFIESHRKRGLSVLVHCRYGRSRSATIIIAYLIGYCGMTFNEAYRLLNNVRKDGVLPYEYDFLSAYKKQYK